MDKHGNKAIFLMFKSAETGNVKELRKNANRGNVNAVFKGSTPLIVASKSNTDGAYDIVQRLLLLGADPERRCSAGGSAVHYAAANNDVPILRLLMGADKSLLNILTNRGETPIMWAAAADSCDSVQALIDWTADLTIKNESGQTALEVAEEYQAWSSYCAIKEAVGGHFSDEKRLELIERRFTAWQLANLVKRSRWRSLNSQTKNFKCDYRHRGRTQLMLAAMIDSPAGELCAITLLNSGAYVGVRDWQGWSAVHFAAKFGNNRIVRLLYNCGRVYIHALTRLLQTPLMLASIHNQADTVQLLIELGSDVWAEDVNGDTALRLAELRRSKEAVKVLMSFMLSHDKSGELKNEAELTDSSLSKSKSDYEMRQFTTENSEVDNEDTTEG